MNICSAPAVGTRWRHFLITEPDWDVVVLAVVEHDGATWVVLGELHRPPSVVPAEPTIYGLGEFAAKFSEVSA